MKLLRRNAKMRVAPGSDGEAKLRAELAEAQQRNAELACEIAQVDDALQALQRGHDKLLASNTMLRRQNENLRFEKADVLGRLDAANRRVVELGAENADLKEELEAVKSELEAVKKTAAAAETQAGEGLSPCP